jgi:A/G-specific adenine glycosylase
LRWYDVTARDLPWRKTRDPYAIWVAEVMLQQTRVDTVLHYYERFLARFPDVGALARASEDEVLALWSGLGYYRRARMLHRGARELLARYGGQMPIDPRARRALPGIGRYTAGAIGSIAFDLEEPIVDGNVARVLARLRGIDTPLGRRDTEERLWREAEHLVRGPRPGALNQALMELGSTVCTPRAPDCSRCPLAAHCEARRTDRTDLLPIPRARRSPTPVELVAAVALGPGGVFLVRQEGALFGGLWGLPMQQGRGLAAARDALRIAGIRATFVDRHRPRARIEHLLTHRRLRVRVYVAERARAFPSSSARMFDPDALDGVGVSTLTRHILNAALRKLTTPSGR